MSKRWRCIVVGRPDAEYFTETDDGAERPPPCRIDGVAYSAGHFEGATPIAAFGGSEDGGIYVALMYPAPGLYTGDDERIARESL